MENHLSSFDNFGAGESLSLSGYPKVYREESDYFFLYLSRKEVFHRLCDGSPERKERNLPPLVIHDACFAVPP
jgi:hypothetical protein